MELAHCLTALRKCDLLKCRSLILAGIGLEISNSIAVYEAVSGKKRPFLRTPKQGQSTNLLYRAEVSVPVLGELVAGIASLGGLSFCRRQRTGTGGTVPPSHRR